MPPLAGLGNYDLLIKVKGATAQGKPFELVQGPYSVDYTPVGTAANLPAIAKPDPMEAPITFDSSAMDIPSLDVEELPPEDMEPLPEPEPQPEAVPMPELTDMLPEESESTAEPTADAADSDTNWILLASIFILGNVVIIGTGIYFYIRFLRKTSAEQSRVVNEIAQLKQKQKEEGAAPVVAETAVAASVVDEEPEEATVMRASEPAAAMMQPEPAPVPVPSEPESEPEPEPPSRIESYINDSQPLDLEDDSLVEIDEFDDEFENELPEDVSNLDDIDRMLNDQELDSDTELNDTIDAMLNQPTVFPDKKDRKKAVNDNDSSGFAEDEFMLDNPDSKD